MLCAASLHLCSRATVLAGCANAELQIQTRLGEDEMQVALAYYLQPTQPSETVEEVGGGVGGCRGALPSGCRHSYVVVHMPQPLHHPGTASLTTGWRLLWLQCRCCWPPLT